MTLETLTAPALQRLLAAGARTVVVPFGSIEHQGPHLPLGADSLVADAVARAVAERLGAVVAPAIRVGCAQAHMGLPGTLSLRPQTLTDVAVDVVASLTAQGFERIVLVSAHGGNAAALDEAVARSPAPGVCAPRGDVGPSPGAHSGEWLTSVMLALRPDLVDAASAGQASAARGAAHLERYVSGILSGVRP